MWILMSTYVNTSEYVCEYWWVLMWILVSTYVNINEYICE